MGFWDFFKGSGKDGALERHCKRMTNLNAQAEDRELSAHWLAENGSEEAIIGLLGRFRVTYEHHMKDMKEKDLVYSLLVEIGPAIVEPTRRWIMDQAAFAQPLRLIGHFEGPEAVVEVLLQMLAKEKDLFKPEKKRQILITLAEFPDERAIEPAIACLDDFDEGIRYAAAEALLAQTLDDARIRPALAARLAHPEEESNRLKVRIGEAFVQRNWDLGEHAEGVALRPPMGWSVKNGRLISG